MSTIFSPGKVTWFGIVLCTS